MFFHLIKGILSRNEANLFNVNLVTLNLNIGKNSSLEGKQLLKKGSVTVVEPEVTNGIPKLKLDEDIRLDFNTKTVQFSSSAISVTHKKDSVAGEIYCDDDEDEDDENEDDQLDEDSEAYYLDEYDYELDEEDWNGLEEWCNDIAELDRIIQEHVHSNKVKYPGEGYVWVEPGDTRVDGDEYWYAKRSSVIFYKKELISVEISWHEASVGHTVVFSKQIRRKVS